MTGKAIQGCLVSIIVLALRPAAALELTAVTLFLCDGSGRVDPTGRWNSGPVDAAWDLFIREGEPSAPGASPQGIRWLNGKDNTIRIPLAEGRHTFTFHFEGGSSLPRLGMNLFFNGANDRAGISVFAPTAADPKSPPAFSADSAAATMGWPITEIPGSGSLVHSGAEPGLWSWTDGNESLKATLKDFQVLLPSAAGGLDLVGPHAIGPSGQADFVGRFTLEVERHEPRPPELVLWLQTEAGFALGGPDRAGPWRQRYGKDGIAPPFSFKMGGKPAAGLLKDWGRKETAPAAAGGRRAHRIVWTDPSTGLEVRWDGVEYAGFNTVEWTLHFRNTGSADTPVLSDIEAIDTGLQRRSAQEFLLHHWKGTFVRPDDYEPLETLLKPGASLAFAPPGGRPCGQVFPYFNLETPGEGMILAVSWAGQWAARFERDSGRGLQVRAGQETTHLVLHPGEEVRTPLMALLFWKGGDWIDAQNLWRRWMVRHNLPRPGGKLPPVPQFAACSSHQFAEMINANEENQMLFVDRYIEEGLKLDYWWMDAGWYVNTWGWPHTGTWEVDRKRFPRGLRAISDHARAKGVKTLVWFEPERVAADTWLTGKHPEWIIGGAAGGLLDLGNPEALKWLTDHVDRIIIDEGIDLYRQDYNIDPLGLWRSKDAPDRQGVTENLYVQGYLAYWDELLRRHPDMLIDSCASGGHRNDLETLRRAVPLLRSDYIFEPTGQQGHTYGLAFWMPFFGTAFSWPDRCDPYVVRSNMCPHNTACFDMRRRDLDYALIRRLVDQWREVAPCFLGDYYPLTPYSVDAGEWIAWQFHRSEEGDGMVQAFRREKSPFFGVQLRLRGLDPEARYGITDFDAPGPSTATGRELMDKGLRLAIEARPGAALIHYRRLATGAGEK